MKASDEKTVMRDRTHRVTDGDYLHISQYRIMAISLCVTHILMEFLKLIPGIWKSWYSTLKEILLK